MSSLTDQVYEAIYEEIMQGTLKPDQKLPIAQLAEKFKVGLSPVREALSLLTATNLVIAISQRGFKVTPISLKDIEDLYTTRTQIEKIALALSIEKGDLNWEAELLAAFHKLFLTEKKMIKIDLNSYYQWEKLHRDFNLKLIGACGLKHLLKIQAQLYTETERYRRLWVLAGLQKSKNLKFTGNQKMIMEAAIARNKEKALLLLEQHFEKAKQTIAQYIQQQETFL